MLELAIYIIAISDKIYHPTKGRLVLHWSTSEYTLEGLKCSWYLRDVIFLQDDGEIELSYADIKELVFEEIIVSTESYELTLWQDFTISNNKILFSHTKGDYNLPVEVFYVDFCTGTEKEQFQTLTEAIEYAKKNLSYTQEPVYFYDWEGKYVCKIPWYSTAAEDDDEVIADFGAFGFYDPCIML